AERLCDASDLEPVCGRPEPEHERSTETDEREAELGRDGRFGECLCESDAVRLARMLLRPSPDDPHVRKLGRETLEEAGLASLGLEQRELAFRQRDGEWNPRGASTRSDIDDRPAILGDDVGRAERVVEQHSACGFGIGESGRSRRAQDSLEPALEDVVRHRQVATARGKTTTKRLGSEPSLTVSTSGSSFSASWTI